MNVPRLVQSAHSNDAIVHIMSTYEGPDIKVKQNCYHLSCYAGPALHGVHVHCFM